MLQCRMLFLLLKLIGIETDISRVFFSPPPVTLTSIAITAEKLKSFPRKLCTKRFPFLYISLPPLFINFTLIILNKTIQLQNIGMCKFSSFQIINIMINVNDHHEDKADDGRIPSVQEILGLGFESSSNSVWSLPYKSIYRNASE